MHPVRRRIVDKLGIAAVTSVREEGPAARLRHFCLDLLEGFRAYQTDSVGNAKTLRASVGGTQQAYERWEAAQAGEIGDALPEEKRVLEEYLAVATELQEEKTEELRHETDGAKRKTLAERIKTSKAASPAAFRRCRR